MDQANRQKAKIIDTAKQEAMEERKNILNQAKEEIESEVNRAKEKLRKDISELALLGAQKIIQKNVDSSTTNDIIDDLVSKK
jgi:F-type H+-transporting ATPase subunit b